MKFTPSILEKISTRELEKWQFIERYHKDYPSSALVPSITISRERGSGGKLIAKIIAKKLKFSFYDKKIIELVAKHSRERQDLISSLDEQGRNLLEETVGNLFGSKLISSATYLRNLVKVILSLARKGKGVFLGRGANFIVPPKNSLRVRIIAPLKTRIKNTIEFEGKTKEEAEKDIKKNHFDKKIFIKKYFGGKNVSNANYYDLVINTESLSVEQAAEIIIKTFKKRFPSVVLFRQKQTCLFRQKQTCL